VVDSKPFEVLLSDVVIAIELRSVDAKELEQILKLALAAVMSRRHSAQVPLSLDLCRKFTLTPSQSLSHTPAAAAAAAAAVERRRAWLTHNTPSC